MTAQMERWPEIQTLDRDGWSMGEWKYVEERREEESLLLSIIFTVATDFYTKKKRNEMLHPS